jgi:hypothetical protein
MLHLIQQHRRRIELLCREFHVARLAIFGSASRDDFDPARSDLDFLVDFESPDWVGLSDR